MINILISREEIEKRIVGLDIIRSIAILMVVFYHSREMLAGLIGLPFLGFFIGKLIAITVPFGHLGVEMFFVLSGYLIGGILIKEANRSNNYSFNGIFSFWKRRWLRTLPNYYLVLFLNMSLYLMLANQKFDWKFLIFSQNLFYPHPDSFNEAWSLSIEEWSYLLIPLGLFIGLRIMHKKSPQHGILVTILTFLSLFNMIRIIHALHPVYTEFDIRKIVVFRLDAVMYGILIAYIKIFHPDIIAKYKRIFLTIGILLIIIITGVQYFGNHPSFNYYVNNELFRFWMDALLYTFFPVSFALIVLYFGEIKRLSSRSFENFFIYISLISYSLYLTHYTLIGLPFFYNKHYDHPIAIIFLYLFYWVSVIGVSTLLYKYYEKPFMQLRDNAKSWGIQRFIRLFKA